jgi:hypothetical protein
MRALAFALATLFAAGAHADETEVSFAYVPATGAESITVEQPMGTLSLNGWDKPEVRIVARKRAPSGAMLDRLKVNVEMRDGRIRIRTGLRMGDGFRALPASTVGSPGTPPYSIDLSIEAPRSVQLAASTWSGDLDASGFRAGADLSSAGGEVRARDISGRVKTHALSGRQMLSAIHGDVDADGVTGDVTLDTVDGDTLEAKVVEGQITARDINTPVVRLFSTAGGIVMIGSLRPGGRYELATRDGDLRLQLKRGPMTVDVSASGTIRSALVKVADGLRRFRGELFGGGPQLLLTAAHGDIILDPY